MLVFCLCKLFLKCVATRTSYIHTCLNTSMCDKRDDFHFHISNFPFPSTRLYPLLHMAFWFRDSHGTPGHVSNITVSSLEPDGDKNSLSKIYQDI